MDEYITKRQAIEACLDGYASCVNDCVDNIKLLPAVNVREVIYGHWIFDDFDGDGLDYQCSNCKTYTRLNYDYCPKCGAEMRG